MAAATGRLHLHCRLRTPVRPSFRACRPSLRPTSSAHKPWLPFSSAASRRVLSLLLHLHQLFSPPLAAPSPSRAPPAKALPRPPATPERRLLAVPIISPSHAAGLPPALPTTGTREPPHGASFTLQAAVSPAPRRPKMPVSPASVPSHRPHLCVPAAAMIPTIHCRMSPEPLTAGMPAAHHLTLLHCRSLCPLLPCRSPSFFTEFGPSFSAASDAAIVPAAPQAEVHTSASLCSPAMPHMPECRHSFSHGPSSQAQPDRPAEHLRPACHHD